MSIRERLIPALFASSIHLGVSLLVAGLSAGLVFGLWFPGVYQALAGGFFLWVLVVLVDVVCGPLLTFVVFDRNKSREELVSDISIIVLLQLIALAYGIYKVAQARPVFLAYEGDRFRVVSVADVDPSQWKQASAAYRSPSWIGPQLVGVRLATASDPDYRDSVLLAMQGVPPAFRPERWVPYDSLLMELDLALRPISALKLKHPEASERIDGVLAEQRLAVASVGYLPLEASKADPRDWVVVVARSTGRPRAFLPLDGW